MASYRVFSHMEQLDEDTLYFFLKSGLLSRITFEHRANANKRSNDTEEK